MKSVLLSEQERTMVTNYLCNPATVVDRSYEPFLNPRNEIAEDFRETSQAYALCCLAIDEAIKRLNVQNPGISLSEPYDRAEILLRAPHLASFFDRRERLKNQCILLEHRYIMHEMILSGANVAITIPGGRMISQYGISSTVDDYEWHAGRKNRRLLVQSTRNEPIFDRHTTEKVRGTVFLPNGEPRIVENEVQGTALLFWSLCENTLSKSRDGFSRNRN